MGQTLKLLLVVAVCVAAVIVIPTPWVLHIGGEVTPWMTWRGFGPVQASNGGRYILFIRFTGGIAANGRNRPSCSGRGCDDMFGEARLCTQNGTTHIFKLAGMMHGWWSTEGAKPAIRLTGGAPAKLPSGWVVAFHGTWKGPELTLDSPDNSFTKVFTPAGMIRRVTSTADAGTAHVTLKPGSLDDFDKACKSIATP